MGVIVLWVLVLLVAAPGFAQVAATQPAAVEVIRAADDYASRAFQDPWDMNQRTDLGTITYGIDEPPSGISGISMSGGIFSATSINDDPNFWLLDTGNPFAANIGKLGKRFPINSTKYRRLVMKINLAAPGLTPNASGWGHVHWSNNTIYPPGGVVTSNIFNTWPGWWIYSLDMPALGTATLGGAKWTDANVDSLRVDPVHILGANISLDWARLVEDVPGLYRNIQWTGSGAVDIYLDDDRNPANGLLAQIARDATGNSFSFYVGGLPQGTYNVVVARAGTTTGPYSYAPGSWQIQDIPLLSFTSPSPDGSSDDFATTQLNNPWDMNAVSDIEEKRNVGPLQIVNLPAENEQGESLGVVRLLQGTSTPTTAGSGDPYLYPFFFQASGATKSIDTNRYRLLVLEMGVQGPRDLNRGSIARIVWRNKGGSENVSDDIMLNHREGATQIQTLRIDMKTLPLDPISPTSRAGWNGQVDSFRVDPHEFPEARTFWIKSIKLAAFEKATSKYAIRWAYTPQGATGVTLALYYDGAGTGYNGTQIAAGLDPSTGTYNWDVSAIQPGTYYIYGVFRIGGTIVNQAYAAWPLMINTTDSTPATLTLGRSTVAFGSTGNGATVTPPQEITVEVKGPGPVSWTVAANQPWISVSPASGTGTGRFTILVQTPNMLAPLNTEGLVTVTSANASNSPQSVRVLLASYRAGASSVPYGTFDTPADNPAGLGPVLAGSVAVTGWTLDDIGIKRLEIWRDPIGNEPRSGNGYVYIGNAMFVAGARPDVESKFPSNPWAYRAGWGYMMLTNMLPGKGNGTFRLHAIAVDEEGNQVKIGTRTIVVDNLHAIKPFGALDSPGPGQVVAGITLNDGWALTPQPATIPFDGSTILVNVDGVDIGHPNYGTSRADIVTFFPGLTNTNASAGSYYLGTSGLANGMHTIAWNVYDNQGRGDGIGSRYFTVQNGAAPSNAGSGSAPAQAARALQLRTARLHSPVQLASAYPALRRGYGADRALLPIRRAGEGVFEPIELAELDRLEIYLQPGHEWSASLRHGDELRALPIGSTFDAEGGIFYWQLGPGFLGEFPLEFRNADGTILSVVVKVGGRSQNEATIAH